MKLLISALEPSSNLHLKEVLKYLDSNICGIYDKDLSEQKPLYDMREFSVMGFIDVISKVAKAKEAIDELCFLAKDCDKALLIDAPSFNIRLAKKLKERNPNIKIIYYILPKVWAWKKNRVKQIEKYCDEIISIFPFENKFYKSCKYLGNPLLDEIKIVKENLNPTGKVAFLAGSRRSEIKKLMPIFRQVAKKIDKEKLLVVPSFFSDEDLKTYGDINDFKVIKDTHKALNESDFAFVCSGTASLEASIIGVPFVLVYKAKALDYFIAKRFVKLKYVGLANIIFDFLDLEPIHREFLQSDVNEQNLLNEYQNIDREAFFEKSKKLKEILENGSSKKVAELIKK